MTRVAVNGLHLNVEEAGEGRPLVLLHGFTGSADSWRPLMDRLSITRRVVAVDLLGHGKSDSPPAPERYRVERQMDDLTALLDALSIAEYDLLGYSMGGRLALRLALAHGHRVRRLILESASPGIQNPEERASRVQEDERLANALERDGLSAFVDYWERIPLFASQERLPAGVRAGLRRQRLSSDPQGLAGSLRGFGAGAPEPLFERLRELPRSLLITGELDEKYCRLAREMEKSIPDARLAIVPDAGHAVHLEKPDAFLELVIAFLDGAGNSVTRRSAAHHVRSSPGDVASVADGSSGAREGWAAHDSA